MTYKPGAMSTEALTDLAEMYLDRLRKGECPPDDQPVAATILWERIRTLDNGLTAARQVAQTLAAGIHEAAK